MYKLENLSYLYQDLEPYIDTHTMGLHYNKHAKNYLDHLNKLLKQNDFDFSISLEELATSIFQTPFENQEEIVYYLGGVLNHNMYFKNMGRKRMDPAGLLRKDLIEKYGSIEDFQVEFIRKALLNQGSGYTFLELTKDGDLAIVNYSLQDNPIFHGGIPLFTVDLWEHAYYLNYKNNRLEYLTNFFEVADFSNANDIYNKQKMVSE